MNPFVPLASKSLRSPPSSNQIAVRPAGDGDLTNLAGATTAVLVTEIVVIGLVEVAGVSLSAYHGYKRNHDSTGAAVVWGFFGLIAPLITPIVAVAQGYAKPERL